MGDAGGQNKYSSPRGRVAQGSTGAAIGLSFADRHLWCRVQSALGGPPPPRAAARPSPFRAEYGTQRERRGESLAILTPGRQAARALRLRRFVPAHGAGPRPRCQGHAPAGRESHASSRRRLQIRQGLIDRLRGLPCEIVRRIRTDGAYATTPESRPGAVRRHEPAEPQSPCCLLPGVSSSRIHRLIPTKSRDVSGAMPRTGGGAARQRG